MNIRPFHADDEPEWRRLRHMLWPETTDRDHRVDLAECLASPETHRILIAEVGMGELIGIAEVRLRSHANGCETSPVGFLEGWIVDPMHRRQGVGGALVRAAEQWCRERGCREFASDTHVENLPSRAAHRALGFVEGAAVVGFHKKLDGPASSARE